MKLQTWTSEGVQTVIAGFRAGVTMTAIGFELGVSRNAIAGLIRRLRRDGVDLEYRRGEPLTEEELAERKAQRDARRYARLRRQRERVRTLSDVLPTICVNNVGVASLGVPFLALADRHCRFPLSERHDHNGLPSFCGQQRSGRKAWCEEHAPFLEAVA